MITIVLDTNTLMNKPLFFLDYFAATPTLNYRLILLKTVLDELDILKNAEDTAFRARRASRALKELTAASPKDEIGLKFASNGWLVIDECTEYRLPRTRRYAHADDRILACAEIYRDSAKEPGLVYLATSDQNMILRARERNLGILNPSEWVPVKPNQFVLSMTAQLFGSSGPIRLPVDLGDLGKGWVEVWPERKYSNGPVHALYIRLYEAGYDHQFAREKASPMLILRVDGEVSDIDKLITTIPYKVVHPRINGRYSVVYKGWKVEVKVDSHPTIQPAEQNMKDECVPVTSGDQTGCQGRNGKLPGDLSDGFPVGMMPTAKTKWFSADLSLTVHVKPLRRLFRTWYRFPQQKTR